MNKPFQIGVPATPVAVGNSTEAAGAPNRLTIPQCRRPRETQAEFERRVVAEEAAFQRLLRTPLTVDRVCGNGTFDMAGNPRGSGWA